MRGKTVRREVWEAVRSDYLLARGSCRELAERYGLTESAVLSRAKREKWRQDLADTETRFEAKLEAELDRRAKSLAQRAEAFVERSAFNAEAFLDLVDREREAIRHGDIDALNRLAGVLKTTVDVGRRSFNLDSPNAPASKLLAPTVQVGITLVQQPEAIDVEAVPPDTGAANQSAS